MAVAVFKVVALLLFVCSATEYSAAATWCVARNNASDQALQTALDYACGGGADCAPLQSSGLCYLPNTVQAHASYAFNSYYQRKGSAPGSCSFAGTAFIAQTDPSYGSCVYPSSPSTAGGATTPGSTPNTIQPPSPPGTTQPLYGNGRGFTSGIGTVLPYSPKANASPNSLFKTTLVPGEYFQQENVSLKDRMTILEDQVRQLIAGLPQPQPHLQPHTFRRILYGQGSSSRGPAVAGSLHFDVPYAVESLHRRRSDQAPRSSAEYISPSQDFDHNDSDGEDGDNDDAYDDDETQSP